MVLGKLLTGIVGFLVGAIVVYLLFFYRIENQIAEQNLTEKKQVERIHTLESKVKKGDRELKQLGKFLFDKNREIDSLKDSLKKEEAKSTQFSSKLKTELQKEKKLQGTIRQLQARNKLLRERIVIIRRSLPENPKTAPKVAPRKESPRPKPKQPSLKTPRRKDPPKTIPRFVDPPDNSDRDQIPPGLKDEGTTEIE